MPTADYLPRHSLSHLFDLLQQHGYRLVGPQVIDGAILYRPLTAVDQLPSGTEQVQQPGQYRLIQTDSPRRFSWANGPQALKPLTFTPRETLWRSQLHEAAILMEL